MIKKILLSSFLLIALFSKSQQVVEKIYSKEVNGIQFFNPETNDETPIYKLGSGFILYFDMLDKGYERLYYKLKHYDRNWEEDNLFDSEYIQGYAEGQIRDYVNSFNTNQTYIHYTLKFPNEEMRLKISGNYLFTVYDNKKKPLFSKKISFYESEVNVGVNVERYQSANQPGFNQRVIVNAVTQGNSQSLITNQLSLCILQNNNWNLAKCNIRPQFINGNKYIFDQISNVFEGGNEFYSFDTKNITISGFGVDRVENTDDGKNEAVLYSVLPYPETYSYNPDVNGAYYFRRFDLAQERDAGREGDYGYVNFFVQHPKPFDGVDIYVVGLFNNYELSEKTKMEYNEEFQGYQKILYLKQGYYNYTYAVKDKKSGRVSLAVIPGSFWETENLYQGLLYYSPFGQSYDALIGYGEKRAPR